MRLLIVFIARIIANSIGIIIATYFVQGISFKGDWVDFAVAGIVLAVANSIIKPILKFLTGPLIVLTMGLFLIVINIIILWLVTWLVPELTIVGFWAYFWGVVIISIINALVSGISKKKS